MRKRLTLAALVAVFAVVVGARVIPMSDEVFSGGGGVRLLGTDAYYHLRHARLAAQNFPHLEREDPSINYPWGMRADAAGFFDLGIAGAALLARGGVPDEETVARVAAWMPVALVGLALAALFALGARLAGLATGVLACALWALYPGQSLPRTVLGFADHHAAEIALALLTAVGLERCLARAGWRRDGARRARVSAWWPDLLHTWPLALFLFTWRGAPLYVLLAGFVVWLAVSFQIVRAEDPRPTAQAAWRYAFGVALLAGLPAFWWPWLVLDPQLVPVLVAGILALAIGPLLYAEALRAVARAGVPRALTASLGVIAVGAGLAALAAGHPLGRRAVELLLLPKTDLLMEHEPVTALGFWKDFGPMGVLALLSLPFVPFLSRRPSWQVPVVFAASLTTVWIATGDYGYAPPAFLALVAALGVGHLLASRVAARWRLAPALLAVICIAPIWPLRVVKPPWPTTDERRELLVAHEGWWQAMRWLRGQLPPVSEPDPESRRYPANRLGFGVASAWDYGTLIAELGRRTPVYSRYPTPQAAGWIVAQDELEALSRLCPWCLSWHDVRYVVVDARTAGDQFLGQARLAGASLDEFGVQQGSLLVQGKEIPRWSFGPKFERSMAAQLFLDDGQGLHHLRLVYESPHQSFSAYEVANQDAQHARFSRVVVPVPSEAEHARLGEQVRQGIAGTGSGYRYDGRLDASVKIFERVEGARLTGPAAPGAAIEAELTLYALTTGRTLRYQQRVLADASGRFELVIPHSTERQRPGAAVEAVGRLRVRVEREPGGSSSLRELALSERQVLQGARVELGPLS